MSTRREFLVGCSTAIAAMAGARFGTLAFADSNSSANEEILVFLFLRGGMDGLNLVAPVDDVNYITARTPETMISGSGATAGLPLGNAYPGGDFRLHHSAGGLKELYDNKNLALIHASGLTNGTRSHFEAQDLVDLGVADMDYLHYNTGWLDRLISASNHGSGIIPVVSVGGSVPKSLFGDPGAVAMSNPATFAFYGTADQKQALESIYSGKGLLPKAGAQTIQNLDLIQSKIVKDKNGRPLPYSPTPSVNYPKNSLGNMMQSLAELIKMEVGLQFATVDFGGWDTHQIQGPQFNNQAQELSDSLASFWNDIQQYQKKVTLVCVSEFGRRVKANQSNGTDHGHGNVMLVLGGDVNGGKMHGTWPGLATQQLDQGADLAVTTDYRNVLAEIAQKKYGIANPASLFPGLKSVKEVGVLS